MATIPSILILDDNNEMRMILADILESHGYRPLPANDRKTALDIIESERPLVGIIDLMLPDASGLEVIAEINRRFPDIECIILTAYASQESAIHAIRLGAYGYIPKPFDIDHLLATVREAIEKRATTEAQRTEFAQYHLIFEHAHHAMLIADTASGAIIDANREAQRLTGRSHADLAGSPLFELVSGNQRETFQAAFATFVRERRMDEIPLKIRGHDDAPIAVALRVSVVELEGAPFTIVSLRAM